MLSADFKALALFICCKAFLKRLHLINMFKALKHYCLNMYISVSTSASVFMSMSMFMQHKMRMYMNMIMNMNMYMNTWTWTRTWK